jgi:hypothetical protein
MEAINSSEISVPIIPTLPHIPDDILCENILSYTPPDRIKVFLEVFAELVLLDLKAAVLHVLYQLREQPKSDRFYSARRQSFGITMT